MAGFLQMFLPAENAAGPAVVVIVHEFLLSIKISTYLFSHLSVAIKSLKST